MHQRSDLRLRERIRAQARALGFQRCRFARLGRPVHAAAVGQWIADGCAAGMAYMERGLRQRLDPQLLVPGARSIISVAYSYRPPPAPPLEWRQHLRGRIAAYARGTDYHRLLRDKLRALAAVVHEAEPAALTRPYVDTGAILEREWAGASGVGWFGKHTNLLHRTAGSYFLLGELVTDIDFEPDPPTSAHCGTCTRCLDRCPTGALRPGYLLDARLCISYLTIEHRGSIPVEMRARLGQWVFGCDICQEVCPWNGKLAREPHSEDASFLHPYLPDLLGLGEEAFQRRFRGTAVHRAGREGLARNVAVALGNSGATGAVPPLALALRHDPAAVLRAHAAWALGRIGNRHARAALTAAHQVEPAAMVRDEIASALSA